MKFLGECLCGEVKYEMTAEPLDKAYCHCTICRRANSAFAVAWVTVPVSAFRFTQGQAAEYRSSSRGLRRFCANCGSQLTFQYWPVAETIDVTVASLQDFQKMAPDYHIWTETCPDWLKITDDKPRYPDAGPDTWR